MPPATGDRRWRGGRADRHQIQVLVLTARYLRRRRGPTASVFGRMPLASDPPHLFRSPQTDGVSECAGWYSNMPKAATLRKTVSSESKRCMEPSSKVPSSLDSAVRAHSRQAIAATHLPSHLVLICLNKRRARTSK